MKRRLGKVVLLSMVVAVLIGVQPASARLSITDLGTLGGVESFAFGINNRGQIVGYSNAASSELHAFLWEDGEMTDLGTLPGGNQSIAIAINNRRQVVGHSSISPSGEQLAFLWEDGKMTHLGTLPGGNVSIAWDINNRGHIVGNSISASGSNHAVLWTK